MSKRSCISTPDAPPPIGPYCQGNIAGPFVFTAEEGGSKPDGTLPPTIQEQTDQVISNIEAILKAGYATLDDVTKVTVATKVALDCKERVWEYGDHPILGGSSTSDQIQRQTYYPMDHLPVTKPLQRQAFRTVLESGRQRRPSIHTTTPQPAPPESLRKKPERIPGAILGAYCWDQDARRLGALSNDERAEVVIENVSRFHPELREYVVDHASVDWEEYRWTAGAFVMLKPGELERFYPAAIRPRGPALLRRRALLDRPGLDPGGADRESAGGVGDCEDEVDSDRALPRNRTVGKAASESVSV